MTPGFGSEGGGRAAWSSERSEMGHEDQEKVFAVFQRIGVYEVRRDQVGQNLGVDYAFARATTDEDWNLGFDCHFYSRASGRWRTMDITTDTRKSHETWEKIRHNVDVVLAIPHHTIARAYQGAYNDMKKVIAALDEALGD